MKATKGIALWGQYRLRFKLVTEFGTFWVASAEDIESIAGSSEAVTGSWRGRCTIEWRSEVGPDEPGRVEVVEVSQQHCNRAMWSGHGLEHTGFYVPASATTSCHSVYRIMTVISTSSSLHKNDRKHRLFGCHHRDKLPDPDQCRVTSYCIEWRGEDTRLRGFATKDIQAQIWAPTKSMKGSARRCWAGRSGSNICPR